MSRYATLSLKQPGESTATDHIIPVDDIVLVTKEDPSAGTPLAAVWIADKDRSGFTKKLVGGVSYANAKTQIITTIAAAAAEVTLVSVGENAYADVGIVMKGNAVDIRSRADGDADVYLGRNLSPQARIRVVVDDTAANVVTALNA
ncbi:hypothetical protein [uncultured Sphaerochaeta sp.]|uniref:hypothetical protein n=1 Tax=uncultured Sphaerochaeta sp. TaxID=886478 RepID=UPI002635A088|nr:hypothetical protein [uncultured Sphaerochaeta sp.]